MYGKIIEQISSESALWEYSPNTSLGLRCRKALRDFENISKNNLWTDLEELCPEDRYILGLGFLAQARNFMNGGCVPKDGFFAWMRRKNPLANMHKFLPADEDEEFLMLLMVALNTSRKYNLRKHDREGVLKDNKFEFMLQDEHYLRVLAQYKDKPQKNVVAVLLLITYSNEWQKLEQKMLDNKDRKIKQNAKLIKACLSPDDIKVAQSELLLWMINIVTPNHICCRAEYFETLEKFPEPKYYMEKRCVYEGLPEKVWGKGTVRISGARPAPAGLDDTDNGLVEIVLRDVLYMPDYDYNVISYRLFTGSSNSETTTVQLSEENKYESTTRPPTPMASRALLPFRSKPKATITIPA